MTSPPSQDANAATAHEKEKRSKARRTVAGSGRGSANGGVMAAGSGLDIPPWAASDDWADSIALGAISARPGGASGFRNLEGMGIGTGKRITPCTSTNSHAHCSARGARRRNNRTHAATSRAAIDRPAEARKNPVTIHSEAEIMASSVVWLSPVTFAGPPPAAS